MSHWTDVAIPVGAAAGAGYASFTPVDSAGGPKHPSDAARGVAASPSADEELSGSEAAEAAARERLDAEPTNPDCAYELGRVLYTKASQLTQRDREEDALAALDECQRVYESLHGVREVENLIADVQARRAFTNAHRGFFLSAVADMARAVSTYVGLLARFPASSACQLDCARVLAQNSFTLGDCLDPDLALASADHAVSLYLRARVPEASFPASLHLNLACNAASLASRIHAAHRRLEIACQADHVSVQMAIALVNLGEPGARAALAAALGRSGVHLQASGQLQKGQDMLAQGRALDASAVERALEDWHSARAGESRFGNTLAAALAKAAAALGAERVPSDLVAALVRSPLGRDLTNPGAVALFSASSRCALEQGPTFALRLAELAHDLWRGDAPSAYRLSIEAHSLLVAASSAQTFDLRYRFSDFGEPWLRLLLALSRHLQSEQRLPLALDAAQWGVDVAFKLLPFAVGGMGDRFNGLISDGLRQCVTLLEATGRSEEATQARALLSRLSN
jgi:hypothetical protein